MECPEAESDVTICERSDCTKRCELDLPAPPIHVREKTADIAGKRSDGKIGFSAILAVDLE